MKTENFYIPKTLDAPPLLLLWEADLACVYLSFIALGIFLNLAILGVVVSVFMGALYKRLRDEGGNGLIVKLLYWYTPSDFWFSKRLPSYAREHFGG